MKKIAIINNYPHFCNGGVEKYVTYLIDILSEKYEVVEFFTLSYDDSMVTRESRKIKTVDLSSKFGWVNFKLKHALNKMVQEDEYDLIINNTAHTPISIASNKVITVQHETWDFYDVKRSDKFWRWIQNDILRNLSNKNPLSFAKNIVFFTNESNKGNKNTWTSIPLCMENNFNFNVQRKGKNTDTPLFVGRLDAHPKGLDYLNEVSKILGKQIDVVGGGDTSALTSKNINLVGPLKYDDVKVKMQESLSLVMTSRYEGFPFVFVEALSMGLPVVSFETFDTMDFFKKCPSVFGVKPFDIGEFTQTIQRLSSLSIEEKNELSIKANKFARDHFSFEKFSSSWLQFVSLVLERNHE